MSTTPNYNWPLIEPTDFVTNLPADLEALADDIDSTVYSLDQDNVKITEFVAKGDLLSASAENTPARLGVGTDGQLLAADSTETTGLKWITPGAASANFTLLNTGGTTLSGSSTTISGISGQTTLAVIVVDGELSNTNTQMRFRLNSDTTNNYRFQDTNITGENTYAASMFQNSYGDAGFIDLARNGSVAAGRVVGGFTIFGCNAAGAKPFIYSGGGRAAGGSGARHHVGSGAYLGTSTISSVSIVAEAGVFNGGTVYVYGSAN
jgi:hypothetical protein